jgi:hypothetical protein
VPGWQDGVTQLIVTCCTGFAAPGIELDLVERFGLARTVERTLIGFMGCNAAFNALKHARHVVRSDPGARVLIVALELCSLHFHDTRTMEQILCFMLFADGCAAALVSAAPRGLALDRFHSTLLPASAGDITWHIGDDGFDMLLLGNHGLARSFSVCPSNHSIQKLFSNSCLVIEILSLFRIANSVSSDFLQTSYWRSDESHEYRTSNEPAR